MTTYLPASFFVVAVQGPAGWGIGVAQAAAGRPSEYEHAGMIVDTDGKTVEAEPRGARYGNVSDYAGRHILISDAPITTWAAANPGADVDAKRSEVVANAVKRIGRKYSFADYGSLVLFHLGLSNRWVRARIASSGHELCSQSVDGTFLDSGIHLFDDHPYRDDTKQTRLPGDVMPTDLAFYAEDHR
jgi:hypothetical protein